MIQMKNKTTIKICKECKKEFFINYYCIRCHNLWLLRSNGYIEVEEIKRWFKDVDIEHFIICENFRKSQGGK